MRNFRFGLQIHAKCESVCCCKERLCKKVWDAERIDSSLVRQSESAKEERNAGEECESIYRQFKKGEGK